MRELTDISYLHDLFSRNGFNLKKGLGQNFLTDPTVCPAIAQRSDIDGEGVIEIGPGAGVLTRELAKRAKKVVAVELDTRLMPILSETLDGFDNAFVRFEDAMKCDLHQLIKDEFGDMPVSVCANLPYYITSPLIMKLLEERLPIRSINVMVQKEAALRLCAEMGTRDCGPVTAAVRFYSEPKILFDVGRGSFLPPPKVDSAVIRLDIKGETDPMIEDERAFFRVVKVAFAMRRKTVLNSLSNSLPVGKQCIIDALEASGISPTARAESISMEQFAQLSKHLSKEL